MSIKSKFPSIRPSLLLDFANSKQLDPRITFTRASTATYWDGVTQAKAEENLLLRSQEFDNSYWGKAASTVSANATAAPDDSMTADTVSLPSNLARIERAVSGLSTGAHTFSIYIKGAPGETVNVEIGAVRQAVTMIGSWQRVSVSSSGSASYTVSVIRRDTTAASVEVWGAQLEQRDQATAYTPTTDQPITKYQPALQTAASGSPRFDHNPVTGESLGLLIEEQRTNLTNYSEQIDNAWWTKIDATIASNTVVAPDGTLTGDKLIASTTNSTHVAFKQSLASSGLVTMSVYAKAGEYTWLFMSDTRTTSNGANFNLATGALGVVGANATAAITSVGNGWYRCTVTTTAAAGSGIGLYAASANNTITFTGNGFSGIYIWGAQLEAGSFPTSYIPTASAQVTRTSEAAAMTGANFSSWYRQDEGTLYSEASLPSVSGVNMCVLALTDGSDSNVIGCFADVGYGLYVFNTGITQAALAAGTYSSGLSEKSASSYAKNSFATCLNSSSVATDYSGVVPSLSQLWIGMFTNNYRLNGTIKKIAYYPKRLSNTELQTLTA